ncbi:MAG: hypothetical protein MUC42_01070 [Bryobacter sp.]|jgi:hypothetical protein|nr:hypothetical protein [Bryobacter sp.]
MLSTRLIQQIETHWQEIAARAIARIRNEPELIHIGGLPDHELLDSGEKILHHLDHWLADADPKEVAARFEELGRVRRREGIPLHESVRAVQLVKELMLEFMTNQGLGHTTVEIYASEELEHQAGRFFDAMIYSMVRGYEEQIAAAGKKHLPAGVGA